MRIVIAGASGFIGRALCRRLIEERFEVLALSRFQSGSKRTVPDAPSKAWNPDRPGGEWEAALEDADAVINLCGENIAAGRWSEERKKKILESRLTSTRSLIQAIGRRKHKPKILINASAVGYYGPRGESVLDETSGPGTGFLAQVCQEWETEAMKAEKLGLRTVRLRIGIVLGQGGGALGKMLLPFRLGLGGCLGAGDQWMSWVGLEDLCGLVIFALKDNRVQGAVNATAPHPATNKEFTAALAHALRRPAIFPAPAFALKLALGEMAQEMLLSGQRVMPRKALDLGFKFKHTTLAQAFKSILN